MMEGHLAQIVLAGEVESAIKACLEITDGGRPPGRQERADLAEICQEVLGSNSQSPVEFSRESKEAATVVALTLLSVNELKKCWFPMPTDQKLAFRLISGRSQRTRDAWVTAAIERLSRRSLHRPDRGPHPARQLIAQGLARRPEGETYTLALIANPHTFDLTSRASLGSPADVLRNNPDLLTEEFWKLFEVQGTQDISLTNQDQYGSRQSWHSAVVELVEDGTLDRQRVLDASLSSLARGFIQYRVRWFSVLHEGLKPTPQERMVRSSTYLELTTSPIRPTVSMALKALTVIQKHTSLDTREVIATIGPALTAPAKGTAKSAISVFAKAADADPKLTSEAAIVMTVALRHSATEVQSAGLGHLIRWEPNASDHLRALVESVQPDCHPTVRSTIDAWLKTSDQPTSMRQHATDRSRPSVRRVGVEELDWLGDSSQIHQYEESDDLFEQMSMALENPSSGEENERIINSVAASDLAQLRQDARASTLGRRAAKLIVRPKSESQSFLAWVVSAALVPDLLGDSVAESEAMTVWSARSDMPLTVDRLLAKRTDSLATRLATGQSGVPLAAPTHDRGVIDPVVFAERLQTATTEPSQVELQLALLRLAPVEDKLNQALAMLEDQDPSGLIHQWLSGWFEYCQAESTQPTRWSHSSTVRELAQGRITHYYLHIEGGDSIGPPTVEDRSNLAVAETQSPTDSSHGQWLGLVLPGLPSTWARICSRVMVSDQLILDGSSHGTPAMFDRWFESNMVLGDQTHFLLVLALNDPYAPVRITAVDLIMAAIADHRFDPRQLGQHLGELMSTGVIVPNRYAGSLEVISQGGPEFETAIIEALMVTIAAAKPQKPQHLLKILELLEVLVLNTQVPMNDDTAAALGELTGKGKTVAVAKRLLAIGETSS